MIARIRSEYDDDIPNKLAKISPYKSSIHQNAIRCSLCGKLYYADGEKFSELERLIKYDPDNQFLCENCEREYQDIE